MIQSVYGSVAPSGNAGELKFASFRFINCGSIFTIYTSSCTGFLQLRKLDGSSFVRYIYLVSNCFIPLWVGLISGVFNSGIEAQKLGLIATNCLLTDERQVNGYFLSLMSTLNLLSTSTFCSCITHSSKVEFCEILAATVSNISVV